MYRISGPKGREAQTSPRVWKVKALRRSSEVPSLLCSNCRFYSSTGLEQTGLRLTGLPSYGPRATPGPLCVTRCSSRVRLIKNWKMFCNFKATVLLFLWKASSLCYFLTNADACVSDERLWATTSDGGQLRLRVWWWKPCLETRRGQISISRVCLCVCVALWHRSSFSMGPLAKINCPPQV